MKLNRMQFIHDSIYIDGKWKHFTLAIIAINPDTLRISISIRHENDMPNRRTGNAIAVKRMAMGNYIEFTFNGFVNMFIERGMFSRLSDMLTDEGMKRLDFEVIKNETIRDALSVSLLNKGAKEIVLELIKMVREEKNAN